MATVVEETEETPLLINEVRSEQGGQRRRRRNETRNECATGYPCFSKVTEDCTPLDQKILITHLLTITLCLAATSLTLASKQVVRGHCLLASNYGSEGPMRFEASSVLCDIPMYSSLAESCLIFTFIMVNWVALMHSQQRWILVQLLLTALGLTMAVVAVVFLSIGMYQWCDNMKNSYKHCPERDSTCHNMNKVRQGCLKAAVYFDENTENGQHPQKLVFSFTVSALIVMCITLVCWIIIVVFMGIWLHKNLVLKAALEAKQAAKSENAQVQQDIRDPDEPTDLNGGDIC